MSNPAEVEKLRKELLERLEKLKRELEELRGKKVG
jgi:hypothetical protein